MKMPLFSVPCLREKKIRNIINKLKMCLFFVRSGELLRTQRKFPDDGKLSAELSTGFVDTLRLEASAVKVQVKRESCNVWND